MGVAASVKVVAAVALVTNLLGGGLPEGDYAVLVGGHQGRSLRAPASRLHNLRAALLLERLHEIPPLRLRTHRVSNSIVAGENDR